MNWLITGEAGQLGLALRAELGERGIDFVSVDSQELDITDQSKVNEMITSIRPSVIINAAAWTDVDGAEANESGANAVNALGPQNLAMAAKEVRSKLVQVSTDYVFSGEASIPWSENADHKPPSVYGSTKSAGEKLVLSVHPTGSYVVRTAWLYSAERKNFAKTMVKLALNGHGEVRVVNDQVGQPTFTGDLAKQIVDLVLSSAPVGIYHGTNSGQATWFEFAQEIFKAAGADVSRVVPVSSSEYPRPAKRPSYSVLSHEAWAKTSVEPMRDWRIALEQAMPAIINVVKTEG
jgi:dTDP-4-dehydrorhamnose reductase